MAAQTFGDFLAERHGRTWVVAPRLTQRLRDRGYTVALSQKKYRALEVEWETLTYGAPLASLHKAAPNLLAELRRASTILHGVVHPAMRRPDDGLAMIDAAIAAAEGRE